MPDVTIPTDRPPLPILGRDGNALILLGAAREAAREAGWPREAVEAVLKEAMAGDYDHLLVTLDQYFTIEEA